MYASTIAKVPDDFFEPGRTSGDRRRAKRIRVSLILVVALVAGAAGFGGVQFFRHNCHGLAWPDFHLSKVEGECIGWTIDRAFAFEPALKDVTDRIADENRSVQEAGVAFVRVAVVMPLTSAAGSALTGPAIKHSLEGIAIAQLRANRTPDFLTPKPLIQVVLMNEGRDQTHWRDLRGELEALRDDPHPVVAAVGLGISIPDTKSLAQLLSELKIPAIGGVLTATNLSTPGLFQVGPSNEDYVTALESYLKDRPELKKAVLAYDTKNDLYTQSLKTAFERATLAPMVKAKTGFIGSVVAHDVTPAVVDDIRTYVCITDADMVFYAGRDRDLSVVIRHLALRGGCATAAIRPIVILTGSTGLNLDPDVVSLMVDKQITLIDASSSDAARWTAHVDEPIGFGAFRSAFVGTFAADDLIDGYAIGHHDAFATAAWAIHRFSQQAANQTPKGPDILGQIINLNSDRYGVPAAGGKLTFDDASGGWPHGKKVALVQLPADGTTLPSFTTS